MAALAAVWALCWAFGAQLVSHSPIASTSAAELAVQEVRTVQDGIRDRARFAAARSATTATATRPATSC